MSKSHIGVQFSHTGVAYLLRHTSVTAGVWACFLPSLQIAGGLVGRGGEPGEMGVSGAETRKSGVPYNNEPLNIS